MKNNNTIQKITPFLWFNENAEEAVNFYVSIFKNSRVGDIARYNVAGSRVSGRPDGSIMTINFWLDGQEFTALNGGPQFQFTHAVSFVVNCNNQAEIDYYWEKLSAFGKMEPCGWLKDQFGVSWQIVPTLLKEFLKDSESDRAERTMEEMLKMSKIDIATLEKAYHGSNPGPSKLSPRKRAKKIAMNK